MENQQDHKTGWTVKELAGRAGLNPSRIRQLLLTGEIKGFKRGPIWLIPNAEAERWLENRKR
jgi:hypothetical protein